MVKYYVFNFLSKEVRQSWRKEKDWFGKVFLAGLDFFFSIPRGQSNKMGWHDETETGKEWFWGG